jgi:Fic family protein
VRTDSNWAEWCIYILQGILTTSRNAVCLVEQLRSLMQITKSDIREKLPKIYSQNLLNNLFHHPYTKREFVEKELKVTSVTASKYLEQLTKAGFLTKIKIKKTNYFVNEPLFRILSEVPNQTKI